MVTSINSKHNFLKTETFNITFNNVTLIHEPKRNLINYFIIISFFLVILSLIDPTNIVPYFITLFYVFLINTTILRNKDLKIIYYFHIYLSFAILIFLWQKIELPQDLGLTGQISGGLDDVIFYSRLKNLVYPYYCYWAEDSYSFTSFLSFIYPLPIYSPLNIIIVNLLGICFIPNLTYKLTEILFQDKIVSKKAEILSLACPFLIFYGCILLRDIWVTSLVMMSLLYFLRRQYFLFLFPFCLLGYIRLGSVVFIIAPIIIFFIIKFQNQFKNKKTGVIISIIIIMSVVVVSFVILKSYLQELTGGKLEDGLLRTSFINKLISMDDNNQIAKLFLLPIPINIIALTIFFLFAPFLSFNVISGGMFLPFPFFLRVLTPVYNIILMPLIYRAITSKRKWLNKDNFTWLIFTILIFSLLLGTISLQIRHKTVLYPFIAILAAFGITNLNTKYKKLSIFILFIFSIFEILIAFK